MRQIAIGHTLMLLHFFFLCSWSRCSLVLCCKRIIFLKSEEGNRNQFSPVTSAKHLKKCMHMYVTKPEMWENLGGFCIIRVNRYLFKNSKPSVHLNFFLTILYWKTSKKFLTCQTVWVMHCALPIFCIGYLHGEFLLPFVSVNVFTIKCVSVARFNKTNFASLSWLF